MAMVISKALLLKLSMPFSQSRINCFLGLIVMSTGMYAVVQVVVDVRVAIAKKA